MLAVAASAHGDKASVSSLSTAFEPLKVANLITDLGGAEAGRGYASKVLAWNVRCVDMDFSHYRARTAWIVKRLARLSARPDIVLSNSHAGEAAHRGIGYQPRRWAVIPNGFDVERYRPDQVARNALRRELVIEPDEVLLGMVARNEPAKDHATLLTALTELRTEQAVKCLLIGNGVPHALSGRCLRRWCEWIAHPISLGEGSDKCGAGPPDTHHRASRRTLPGTSGAAGTRCGRLQG